MMDNLEDKFEEDCNNFILEKVFDSVEDVQERFYDKKCLIMSINIRRITKNHTKLETFLERLQNKPDIIICTETGNIDNNNKNFFKLSGYNMYRNESFINIADGVILYIYKKTLKYKTLTILMK